MSTLATLQIVLGMDSRGLTTGVAKAQGQVTKFGAGVQRSLGTVVPISSALAGVAVAKFAADSVRASIEFEKSFGRISAISNASAQDIERWRGQVMDLAGETAKAPNELADALFFLSSAGIDANKVMDVLELSSRAAAVGLGSTVDVAKITANALNAYASSGLTAAQVTDTLVAAVREGSAEPEEFAAALGRILPIASKAGIGFDEVTASLAALSNIGLDVNEGVTAMRGLMNALFAPTAKTQSALADLGLTADQVRQSMSEDGIIGTLRMLEGRTKGNIDAMSALVPNVRALTGVFGLTAQEAEKVDAIFANVLDSSGSLSDSWSEMSQNDAFRLEQAINRIKIAGQELAATVLPALAAGAAFVADNLADLTVAFVAAKIAAIAFGTALLKNPLVLAAAGAVALAAGMTKVAEETDRAEASTRSLIDEAQAGLAPVEAQIAAAAVQMAEDVAEGRRTLAEAEASALASRDVVNARELYLEWLHRALDETHGVAAETERWNAVAAAFEPPDVGEFANEVGEIDAAMASLLKGVTGFAGMSGEELKQFQVDVLSSMESATGGIGDLGKTWELTAAKAVRSMERMAEMAGDMAHDFKALDREAVPDEFKAFLMEQGPEAVHAFVTGTEKQQGRWVKAWKAYENDMGRAVDGMVAIAGAGGVDAATAMMLGFIEVVNSRAEQLQQAAYEAASKAALGLRQALEIDSPSKVTREIGVDFMLGFVGGIREELGSLVSAIKDVIGEGLSKARLLQAKELEAMASDLEGRIEKLQNRINSFADNIRSGFDFDLLGGAMGLADVIREQQVAALQAQIDAAEAVGTPDQALIDSLNAQIEALRDALIIPTAAEFGTFLEDQLATARQFAQGLKGLEEAGLDAQLLADLASRGPESLPFIEALLAGGEDVIAQFNETQSAINAIAQRTTMHLVDEVFGRAVERLRDRLTRFGEDVGDFVKALRAEVVGKKVDDVVAALGRLQHALDRASGSPAEPPALTPAAPAFSSLEPSARVGPTEMEAALARALQNNPPVTVPVEYESELRRRLIGVTGNLGQRRGLL